MLSRQNPLPEVLIPIMLPLEMVKRFIEMNTPAMAVLDFKMADCMDRMRAGHVMICRQADPAYFVRVSPVDYNWQQMKNEIGI